ncbi:hypothetical protein VTN96DRAFT_6891 [Rasamsonia emersonii]
MTAGDLVHLSQAPCSLSSSGDRTFWLLLDLSLAARCSPPVALRRQNARAALTALRAWPMPRRTDWELGTHRECPGLPTKERVSRRRAENALPPLPNAQDTQWEAMVESMPSPQRFARICPERAPLTPSSGSNYAPLDGMTLHGWQPSLHVLLERKG